METQQDIKKYYNDLRKNSELYFYLGLGFATLLCCRAIKLSGLEKFNEIKGKYSPAKIEIYDFNKDGLEDIIFENNKGEISQFF